MQTPSHAPPWASPRRNQSLSPTAAASMAAMRACMAAVRRWCFDSPRAPPPPAPSSPSPSSLLPSRSAALPAAHSHRVQDLRLTAEG